MRFSFPNEDPNAVRDKILTELSGRELGKIVDLEMAPSALLVTISKLGTSTLTFDQTKTADGLEYKLGKEKIAFTHKAFKDEVKSKICKIIEKAGGAVLEV